VPLDTHPDAQDLATELVMARAALAAAKVRFTEAEAAVRAVVGEPTHPGTQVLTFRGRTIGRMRAYTERRVNLAALRESWPEVAETVTEEHLRTRLTVEQMEDAA
jgi:hypothetical protein